MWFKLFASCVIVKGKARSLIYDLERASFYDLSNDVAEMLVLTQTHDVDGLKKILEHHDDNVIQALLDQFVENELAFFTDHPECFPDIDFTWESPHCIVNSVIEIADPSCYNVNDVVSQLSELGCKTIQIRILQPLNFAALEEIVIHAFKDVRIQYIELLIPRDKGIDGMRLINLAIAQPRLQRIMVYAAEADRILATSHEKFKDLIIFLKKDIRIDKDEIIKKERFVTNILMFPEALQYNLGLNRKVCIDGHGYIKNYIDHALSFGNVKTHRLKEVIAMPAFQEKWTLSNDDLEVCKDCQYRYACVSNSDIIKKDGGYYKLSMCGFEPDKNVWHVR